MAREEQTGKSTEELIARVWKLAESIGTAILTTWDGKQQHLRPMAAHVSEEEHAIFFLAAVTSGEVQEIEAYPEAGLAFVDVGSNKYVSLNGRASILDDREKIRELWTPFAKAWWDSAEDPQIRLIVFVPDTAELWDSPSKLIAAVKMLGAAVTGAKPSVGDYARVNL